MSDTITGFRSDNRFRINQLIIRHTKSQQADGIDVPKSRKELDKKRKELRRELRKRARNSTKVKAEQLVK